MGLVSQSGALKTISSPTASRLVSDDLNVNTTPDELLSEKPYVKDALSHQTALSYNRSSKVINSIIGYLAGSPVKVTYYHQITGRVRDKSNTTDLSPGLDNVHKAWTKINDFEFKLRGAFDFSYNSENVQSQMTGGGYTYPGFNPLMGDLFLYELESGTLGLFKINKAPNRLNIRSSTCYEIDFELSDIIDQDGLLHLEEAVVETSYFNKRRFLTEAGALLKSDEFTMLTDIEKHFWTLSRYYLDTFLDMKYMQSYMRPDDIYDPYIVKFLLALLPFDMVRTYPLQLVTNLQNWERSVWALLANPNTLPTDQLITKYKTTIHLPSIRDARANSLMTKEYIMLDIEGTSSYIFPEELWFNDTQGSDPQIQNTILDLVQTYISTRTILPDLLFTLSETHRALSPIDQFYQIPILLFLFQQLKDSILTGRSRLNLEDQI